MSGKSKIIKQGELLYLKIHAISMIICREAVKSWQNGVMRQPAKSLESYIITAQCKKGKINRNIT
jgi:hypothetical protein